MFRVGSQHRISVDIACWVLYDSWQKIAVQGSSDQSHSPSFQWLECQGSSTILQRAERYSNLQGSFCINIVLIQ